MKILSGFCLFFFFVSHLCADVSFAERISKLRQKSKDHSNYLNKLLNDSSPTLDSSTETVFEDNEQEENVSIINDTSYTNNTTSDFSGILVDWSSINKDSDSNTTDSAIDASEETDSFSNLRSTDLSANFGESNSAYEELYPTNIVKRRLGNYFGPFFGFALPDDPKGASHQANMGYLFGLRVGRDFGAIRTEGEYSYLSYDLKGDNPKGGSASLHNLFSRFILERELADHADLRVGVGLGLTSMHLLSDSEVCFAYDFLIGWSYRISNNWGMSFDYRYYLTAANKSFGRSEGHILEISANFDL